MFLICSWNKPFWRSHNQLEEKLNTRLYGGAAAGKLLQSCPTLCDPIDGSPLGSSVSGFLQARILEWVAISCSNAWKWKAKVKSLSRAWLSDPMGCSLPGSSIYGIFQARVLEWGAIAFSERKVIILKFYPEGLLKHRLIHLLTQ